MKDQILAWLARQLTPHFEAALRTVAAAMVAELQQELERRAAERDTRPTRRFIGQ